MKRILTLAVLLLLCGGVRAQQEIKSELSDFRRVDLAGKLAVKMVRSDTCRIEIRLNHTEIKKLDWNLRDGILSVRLKPGNSSEANGEVTIYYDELSTLNVWGASVVFEDVLEGNMFDADLQSGAVLSMKADLKDLYLKLSGNSAADVSGTAKYYTLFAGAKSKAETRSLVAQDARVEASSGAEVYVYADERLQIKAATGASVFYRGEPDLFRSSSGTMATIDSIGK